MISISTVTLMGISKVSSFMSSENQFEKWVSCLCVMFSLCVIGLAPTHIAFKDEGGITNIDFNVGKSDRSVLKVSGKRKKVFALLLTFLTL